jgi:hypothetical protein
MALPDHTSEGKKRFALSQVIATALITFLVSGIGGALFQQYLSRSKPEILVSSIGFRGPSQGLLRLSDGLLKDVEGSALESRLPRYEEFKDLVSREQSVGQNWERLRLLVALLNDWKEGRGETADISASVLLRHPCLKSYGDLCRDLTTSLLRNNKFPLLPITGDAAKKFSDKLEIKVMDGSIKIWRITKGGSATLFAVPDALSDRDKQILGAVVESLSRGIGQNLSVWSDSLIAKADSERVTLGEIRESLRAEILPAAHLAVDVSIYNGGKSPVAFKPYFLFQFVHQRKKEPIVLYSTQKGSGDAFSEMVDMMPTFMRPLFQENLASEVSVDRFLPESGTSRYITIPPGGIESLTLVATTSLGDLGVALKEQYRTGLLDCKVVGVTTAGAKVRSKNYQFAESINEDEVKEVKLLDE